MGGPWHGSLAKKINKSRITNIKISFSRITKISKKRTLLSSSNTQRKVAKKASSVVQFSP